MEQIIGSFDVDGDDSGIGTAENEKTEKKSKWKKENRISIHWNKKDGNGRGSKRLKLL